MTRKISRLGLLLSMASVLGGDPLPPEGNLYRAPETRRRPAPPQPTERTKTQREIDAEAKRARRRERNLRNAAKAAQPAVVLKTAADYFIGVDFASKPTAAPTPWAEVEAAPAVPWALTPNQQVLLTHLEGGYDRPVAEILPYFPTPQSARATIAAAVKVGLVEVLGVLIRITPFGVVSLNAAR